MQQQTVMANPGHPVNIVQQPNVRNSGQSDGCCSLKGVAITELVLGIISFILSAVAVGVAASSYIFGIFVSAPGIWGGLMLIVLGGIGVAQAKNESQSGMHSGGITVGIFTCLAMVVAFGLSVACAYYSAFSAVNIRLYYYSSNSTLDALAALHVLLSLAAIVGFSLSVTHAVLSGSRNNQVQKLTMPSLFGKTQTTMMITTVPTQQYQIPVTGQQPPVYQQPFASSAYPTAEKAQQPQQQEQAYQNLGYSPQPTGQ